MKYDTYIILYIVSLPRLPKKRKLVQTRNQQSMLLQTIGTVISACRKERKIGPCPWEEVASHHCKYKTIDHRLTIFFLFLFFGYTPFPLLFSKESSKAHTSCCPNTTQDLAPVVLHVVTCFAVQKGVFQSMRNNYKLTCHILSFVIGLKYICHALFFLALK